MTCVAGVALVLLCILFSVIDAFLQKSSVTHKSKLL